MSIFSSCPPCQKNPKKKFRNPRAFPPRPFLPAENSRGFANPVPRYSASQNLVRISTVLRGVLGNRFEDYPVVTATKTVRKNLLKIWKLARRRRASLHFGFPPAHANTGFATRSVALRFLKTKSLC